MALLATLVACGGEGASADRVAELAAYNEKQPLRLQVENESRGQVDILYQSPRGGDVPATLFLPQSDGPAPVVIFAHPYLSSRAQFFHEAEALAAEGIASFLLDASISRRGRPDLMDPTYAADLFKAFVRQDVVDMRRGLDFLETRDEVDLERIAVVGQEYGALAGAALAVTDDRIDALVLSTVPAEPGRYWAKEFVPPESHESFAETVRDFDPIRLLDGIDADVLIQNPRNDEDFPVEEYERLEDEAGDAEFRWYEYGHQMGPDSDQDRVRWLVDRLKK